MNFVKYSKKRTTCSELMKSTLTNIVVPTLFIVVNMYNIVQIVAFELAARLCNSAEQYC